MLSYF
jgi:hypothetical protein